MHALIEVSCLHIDRKQIKCGLEHFCEKPYLAVLFYRLPLMFFRCIQPVQKPARASSVVQPSSDGGQVLVVDMDQPHRC